MARATALAVACGSGGDVLPMVGLAQGAQLAGIRTVFACPGALGLHARRHGFVAAALPGPSLAESLDSIAPIVEQRQDAASSWGIYIDLLLRPTLADRTERLRRLVDRVRPDIVLCNGFSPEASEVATEFELPMLHLEMYPQFYPTPPDSCSKQSAASEFSHVHEYVGPCFEQATLILNDPCLASPSPDSRIGHPEVLWAESEIPELGDFLEQNQDRSVVALTFGSFIGFIVGRLVLDMVRTILEFSDCAVIVLNAPSANEIHNERCLSLPFVNASEVASVSDIAVHHGGLGTMMTFARRGVPAAVFPFCFDQWDNATAIAEAGIGTELHEVHELPSVLGGLLDRHGLANPWPTPVRPDQVNTRFLGEVAQLLQIDLGDT